MESVHAERAVTYVPERPHFVEKRMPQVPRLQKMMAKTMPIVKYVNTAFNFVFGSWCFTDPNKYFAEVSKRYLQFHSAMQPIKRV